MFFFPAENLDSQLGIHAFETLSYFFALRDATSFDCNLFLNVQWVSIVNEFCKDCTTRASKNNENRSK